MQNILIVEDCKITQKFLSLFFDKLNLSPDIASTGAEALGKCSRKYFNLIFMDYMLPDMQGPDVALKIKETGLNAEKIVIIGLTATDFYFHLEKCKMAGMAKVLVKPIRFQTLIETLEKYLPIASDLSPNPPIRSAGL